MNKSKFLKKSLAALLAVLMVAAMIPMSAFAADAPFKLRVTDAKGVAQEAKWNGDAFEAAIKQNGDNITVATVDGTANVAYVPATAPNSPVPINNAGAAITLGANGDSKVVSLTIRVGETGSTTDYALNITYTWEPQSSDTSIKKVNTNLIDGAAGDATISGSTITIPMALDHADLREVVRIEKAGAELATNDHRLILASATAGNVGKVQKATVDKSAGTTTWADDSAANAMTKSIADIFEPNESHATVALTSAGLVVTAEDDSTSKYTVKFVYEPHLTSFAIDGYEGVFSGDKKDTVTVELPYEYTALSNGALTKLNAAKATWTTANSDVKVYDTQGTPAEIESGASLHFTQSLGSATNNVYTVSVPNDNSAAGDGFTVATGNTEDNVPITVQVKIPAQNPEAKLTAIKLGAKGQRIEIPEGTTEMDLTLPYSETAVTSIPGVVLYGSTSATASIPSQPEVTAAPSVTLSGADTGVEVKTSVTNDLSLSFPEGYILVKVTSQNGENTKEYKFNIKANGTRNTTLKTFKVTGTKDNQEYVLNGDITTSDTTNKIVVEVPYTLARDASKTWEGWKVTAETENPGASVCGGVVATPIDFASGVTTVATLNGTAVDLTTTPIGNAKSSTKNFIVWTNAADANSATLKTVYDLEFKVGAAQEGNKLTAIAFTDASVSTLDDVTAENTYTGVFEGNTIKVKIPYAASHAAGVSTVKIASWTLDPGATVVLPSATDSATLTSKKITTVPSDTAPSETITVSGSDGNWETADSFKIRVYSEKDWDTEGTKQFDQATDTTKYTEYTIVAEPEEAATGHELTDITSADSNVKIAYNAAKKTAVITVPFSYAKAMANAKPFTLNFVTSDKAKVEMASTTPAPVEITSGTTKFFVDNDGELHAGATVNDAGTITAAGEPLTSGAPHAGTITVWDEAKTASTPYSYTVAVAPAEKDATLASVTVGDATAVADAEDASKWTIVLPAEASKTAKVDIKATSGIATVEIKKADDTYELYNPNTEYDLSGLTIRITAEDQVDIKTYTLEVTDKPLSSVNTIEELTVDAVPAELEGTAYTAVSEDPADIILEITLTDENATATVNGEPYEGLLTGFDATETVTIVVTAEDKTPAEYTLTVTKKQDDPTPPPTTPPVDDNILDKVKDVDNSHWGSKAIADMLNRKIMSTTKGNFNPNGKVTREMFAFMICKLYNINTAEYADYDNPYTDVKKGSYGYNAIMAVTSKVWMTGKSKTTFKPNDSISRQEVAFILASKTEKLGKVTNPTILFADDAKIASWARGYVYAIKATGWMGAGSKFNPTKDITRAEMATVLSHIHPDPVTPDEETPSEETPSEETPSEETPSEETPSEETPSEETPSEENPSEETPSEETPAE